ncbi:hypothetical protein HZI73_20700 [Vallitalea pronyensis]|uniref:Uncharacterized protein n=1 Tax=Vallitalea pronyensis TaxID=1348613 RepID=A0A8J8MMG8_9FIRM|nr:hypothetical protein [Vallitalea pronyensis]QUI24572.1 hypothetical protein HZI73_20700 [Vallitalea pronyensis]
MIRFLGGENEQVSVFFIFVLCCVMLTTIGFLISALNAVCIELRDLRSECVKKEDTKQK